MTGARRAAAAAACALAVAPGAALADGTVRLESGRALATAVVAMGPDGHAAAVYPRGDDVRLVLAAPDAQGRSVGGAPEVVPLQRGFQVAGLAVGRAGRVYLLARERGVCSTAVLLVRAEAGGWTTEPTGVAPAAEAALAADPDGAPSVLAVGCAGDVALRARAADGTWTTEPTGRSVRLPARPSLAVAAGGVAVAGLDGATPLILARRAGAWEALPLPGGPPAGEESVTALRVGLDALARPVALVRRAGVLTFGVEGLAPAADTWSLDRLLAPGAWVPVAPGRVPHVDVATQGGTLAARRSDGRILVEGPAGAVIVGVDAITAAPGAGGRVAYVPRGAPSVLGVGAPPAVRVTAPRRVRFGTRAAFAVSVADGAGTPVARVRVRAAAVSGATDASGAAVLSPVVTRTGGVEVVVAEPGPLAPARLTVPVVVTPQPGTVRARVAARTQRRVVVTGSTRSPVRLPGPLGRAYLVDLDGPPSGFLPGRPVASAAGGRGFRFSVAAPPVTALAVFHQGVLLRLR